MSYGYKTKLIVDSEEFELKAVSYAFDKEINEKGEVASPIQGGTIFLSLQDVPKNSVLEWGIKHRSFKNGTIRVMRMDQESSIKEEEVSFENAVCSNIKMIYQRNSSSYFTTLLTISPENICVGGDNCWVNKKWNQ